MEKFNETVKFIKSLYPNKEYIPLHEPVFEGNEKKFIIEAIDSTYVSSVGEFVNRFEKEIAELVGTKYAIATVNGSAALHVALILAGVEREDEVLTQALTFVATANAIKYVGANPVFIDIDLETMGLSPSKIEEFLEENAEVRDDGRCYNLKTGNRISACIPMHTFGTPVFIDKLINVCSKFNIKVIEDAAESIGSYYKGKHTGSFGLMGTFSFNGNKTITCGGGGAIVTNDEMLAKKAKHLTTQAKVPHKWEFVHDAIGYNYRMPNLNAALACAQLEKLDLFVNAKRRLHGRYKDFFSTIDVDLFTEPDNCESNYWLNAILLKNRTERDEFLCETNLKGIMTRPAWKLMNKLEIYKDCFSGNLENSKSIEDRLVNLPSSVIQDK